MVLAAYSIPDPKDYDVDVAQVVEQDIFKLQTPMNAVIDLGTSDIQTYFRGKSVLVTGATGFLGKLLIEKLLRACEIKKLYLLMRNKKGKNIQERLDYILSDPLFDTVRNKKPDFIDKIVVVSANISDIRLALSDDDWKLITSEVNQIFHLAATTKFDEHIRIATLINVRGTREILGLANECKNLTSFVHVSTAYSTASRSRIDQHIYEQFYPVPIKPEELISFAENYDETKLSDITKLMDDWPNTYTFTKSIAEEMVRTRGANLPVCVVRPPIVCGAYYEPLPGWVDTNAVLGPTGVYLGIILGAIHVIHTSRKSLKQVFIPADYVTNTTIAAAWNTGIKPKTDATKIYTISTIRSTQECGWSQLSKCIRDEPHVTRMATPAAVWFGYAFEIQNKFIFWLLHWIIHLIPAYILDLVFFLFRLKKPPGIQSFVKIYDKIYKLSILNVYFLTNQWYFHDENTLELFEKLSAADKAIFNFDIHTINWKLFTYSWGLGIRKYIIKDGLKDSSYGQNKQKWFKVANCIFFILYALAVWKILALFWSLYY